jgi:hypothetical protein
MRTGLGVHNLTSTSEFGSLLRLQRSIVAENPPYVRKSDYHLFC